MSKEQFPTTRLSLILAAGEHSQEALATLCKSYWYPLYAFVRRQGTGADEAQDAIQGFLARLMEKNALREFDQRRGRFRSFLLASLKNFLANERDRDRAQKRGGDQAAIPLDEIAHDGERRYSLEPRNSLTPEKIFERQWALGLLNRVLAQLREESVSAGKSAQFDRLSAFLSGDDDGVRYRQIAQELAMTEGAVKVAVHRLRQRFHEALREEVSLTVADPAEIGGEIRYLIEVVRGV
jgi:RNA polymerase sigma-70 factor (ECF subfamily)